MRPTPEIGTRCLWLTLADPDPAENGQFLYSSGLIRSVAAAGANLHVVGLTRPQSAHHDRQQAGNVHWRLARHTPRSRWHWLASGLPAGVSRLATREMERLVGEALASDRFDAIVFDSVSAGWALPRVLSYRAALRPRSRLVYLAHDNETRVAREIADNEPRWSRRLPRRWDALRMRHLEQALIRGADLVTADSPLDCAEIQSTRPGKRVEFVPPGYAGHRAPPRQIGPWLARRAVIVGGCDWTAKRISLERFLDVADGLFARAGVELHVVGDADPPFLDRLRRKYVTVTFTGRVPDVVPHMQQARLALVPDVLGGFKLKSLDYVFNRLPILAMQGAVPGVPLEPGRSILLFDSHAALAQGVVQAIDDLPLLNAMHNRAWEACRNRFDWDVIGERLLAAIRREAWPTTSGSIPLHVSPWCPLPDSNRHGLSASGF